jgi:proteasome alpha subunit
MYHIMYDGVVMDEQHYSVLGGQAEQITETLKEQFEANVDLAAACKLGAHVLATNGDPLHADQLEVALLDRTRPRRTFRRIADDELAGLLAD